MELLTTHIGADFDALAAVLVARKLHPGAAVFFPGSREESVRRMLSSGLVQFDELKRRDIDPRRLTRIVLCDCRQKDRLGVVAEWIDAHPGIEVLAYDHHPDSPEDIPVRGGCIDAGAGATATVLVEELRRRGMTVSSDEATLLLLGLYEDSGALTYATTGPRDLEAGAWLLRLGADLTAVRRFAVRRLDAARLELLHRMMQTLEIHRLREHRVGVVALELGSYVDELAPLVSRCLEMADVPLLFAIFGEGERVTLIGRGELAGFDLGQALGAFAGGGGHATAASASLKGATAIEARERLLAFLAERLPPAATAADLMVRSFVTVEESRTIEEAKTRLLEGKVNAAPVVAPGGRVEGLVTRQSLDAAIQHGLGPRPVATAMTREIEWVPPGEPAESIAERMLGARPRLVLVGDPASGRALGVVGRMALLSHLHGRLSAAADPAERRAREQRGSRSQAARLLADVPEPEKGRIEVAARVAREQGIAAYLVGGFVRDLLLGRANRDLDLVVEGDGLHFARLYAAALGGRCREHPAFLTAVVVTGDGDHVDVATARSEFYRAPAALPEVQSSALRQDLLRRDFTINTLAIRLGPEPAAELIDYFGGRRDLEQRTLRVLHSLSLIDDPTRVLRAVRLEARLNFRISPETSRLISIAVAEGVFERLSGSRLRDEIHALFDEPASVTRAMDRLEELGLLGVLHPRLRLDDRLRRQIREVIAALDWYALSGASPTRVEPWRLLLLCLAAWLEEPARSEFADRLALGGTERVRLLEGPPRAAAAAAVVDAAGVSPHQVYRALEGLHGEQVLWLFATGDATRRERLRHYWAELETVRLQVRGTDLLAHGIAPGPGIGRALASTFDARLDGRIEAGDELEYALAVASGRSRNEGEAPE